MSIGFVIGALVLCVALGWGGGVKFFATLFWIGIIFAFLAKIFH